MVFALIIALGVLGFIFWIGYLVGGGLGALIALVPISNRETRHNG